jgi:ubiquinone/menaquinone biosynthesis C-methylase UbiE
MDGARANGLCRWGVPDTAAGPGARRSSHGGPGWGGEMSEHWPTTGFQTVDVADSADYFVAYLDSMRKFPGWATWKAETLAALDLKPGGRFLDVGCGTGEEVVAAARAIAPDGTAVGLDSSFVMGREAAGRSRAAAPAPAPAAAAAFLVADAGRLPFATGSFDACRVERTLQHVPDPAGPVHEMARVLRPGGRVVLFEPDSDTLVLSSPDEHVGRRMLDYRRHLNPSRTVGRHLPRLAAAAGLDVESVGGRLVCLTTYEQAVEMFRFDVDMATAPSEGWMSGGDADAWLASLRAADAIGGFMAMMTMVLVVARQPAAG